MTVTPLTSSAPALGWVPRPQSMPSPSALRREGRH